MPERTPTERELVSTPVREAAQPRVRAQNESGLTLQERGNGQAWMHAERYYELEACR